MESRNKYFTEYKKKNYKRIPLEVSKEQFEQIKKHSEDRGESVNGFIKRAINETMERESDLN